MRLSKKHISDIHSSWSCHILRCVNHCNTQRFQSYQVRIFTRQSLRRSDGLPDAPAVKGHHGVYGTIVSYLAGKVDPSHGLHTVEIGDSAAVGELCGCEEFQEFLGTIMNRWALYIYNSVYSHHTYNHVFSIDMGETIRVCARQSKIGAPRVQVYDCVMCSLACSGWDLGIGA